MTDDWGRHRAEPVAVGPPRRRVSRSDRIREARGRRKRRFVSGFALVLLIVVVVGAVFLGSKLWHTMFSSSNDYSGDGVNDVVIQIHDGDSTTAIGKTLEDHKVVATVKAFVEAAAGNAAISAIQPGYYRVRTEIPASDAVSRLADPHNRVGKLVIPEGRQLDDIQDVKTNAVTDGIFSLISHATCVNLDGDQHCVSVDELRNAAGAGCAVGTFGAGLGDQRGQRAGQRPPAVGRADRARHLEHRSLGICSGHFVHADRDQRDAVRAGRAARHGEIDEHVAVPDPHRRLTGTAGVQTG